MRYNIDGKFPVMANWLIVRKSEDGTYYIKNVLLDEWYEFDEDVYRFLKSLNGNVDPRKLGRKYGIDTDFLMDILEVNFFVRIEGRKLLSDSGTYMRTVYIPQKQESSSIIPKLYNLLLLVCWCPVLIWGIHRLLYEPFELNFDFVLPGYILSLALGMIMHEISHAMASLAYGGSFFEAGVMWKYAYPGAYVLIDNSGVKSKLKRVQIDAAGIEMNLMLAGVLFLLASAIESLSGCFFFAALNNALLGVINCTLISGLDGCSMLGEVIGLKEGIAGAKLILKNNLKKFKWRDMSINKRAVAATCAILLIYQVLLPLLIINNIFILIEGFL